MLKHHLTNQLWNQFNQFSWFSWENDITFVTNLLGFYLTIYYNDMICILKLACGLTTKAFCKKTRKYEPVQNFKKFF